MVRPVCGYNVVIWVLYKLSEGIWIINKTKTKTQGEPVSGNPGPYLNWHQNWFKSHFVLLLLLSKLLWALLWQWPCFVSLPTMAKVTENMKQYLLPEADLCRLQGCFEICPSAQLMLCQHRCGLAGAKQGPKQVVQQQWWVSEKHPQQVESAKDACPKWWNWQPQRWWNTLQRAIGRRRWWFPAKEYRGYTI